MGEWMRLQDTTIPTDHIGPEAFAEFMKVSIRGECRGILTCEVTRDKYRNSGEL